MDSDRGSMTVALYCDRHGAAVVPLHSLAEALAGRSGTCRWASIGTLYASQTGLLQGHSAHRRLIAGMGVGVVSWSKSLFSDRVRPILITDKHQASRETVAVTRAASQR